MLPEPDQLQHVRRARQKNTRQLKQKFLYDLEVNLGFFRTCKQIYCEATKVFYGQNEFRFSGLNGHMVAFAYMSKIGARNFAFMESMTIAMPFRSYDRGGYAVHWNPCTWRRVNEVYDNLPFPYPGQRQQDRRRFPRLEYEQAWHALAWRLANACSLTTLNLVLPEHSWPITYFPTGHAQALSAIDDIVAGNPFLELHIVRVFPPSQAIGNTINQCQRDFIKLLKGTGCILRVQPARSNSKGYWKLIPQAFPNKHGEFCASAADDKNVDTVDVLPDIWHLFL